MCSGPRSLYGDGQLFGRVVRLGGSKKQHQDFQAFTTAFSGRTNRVVTDLRVSEAFDPANPRQPLPLRFQLGSTPSSAWTLSAAVTWP
jgi:hypothetical protein